MYQMFLYLKNKVITDVGFLERYKCKAQLLKIRSIECEDDLQLKTQYGVLW